MARREASTVGKRSARRSQSARTVVKQSVKKTKRLAKERVGTRQVGYAIVGLGHIAQVAVLPAFKHARNARVVALVSSDAEKLEKVGRKYKVKHRFSYDEYEKCLALPEVDAVYIALPNDMHAEFTERAARMGKHVLCEKPMEISREKCERMISACRDRNVKLMIAYRLHFEPGNLRVLELLDEGKIGEPKFFSSEFSFQVQPDNIRTQEERGGGVVWDIGTYCVNGARYVFRSEPEEVFAFASSGTDRRFSEIEETVSCVMRFPDQKLATFTVSFGTEGVSTFRVVGTEGDVCLDQAYGYTGEKELYLTVGGKTKVKRTPSVDQFAPELEYFADCILENREPEPNGEEGLADVAVIEAIYESLRTGQPVKVRKVDVHAYPRREQEYARPPVKEPDLVNVEAPQM